MYSKTVLHQEHIKVKTCVNNLSKVKKKKMNGHLTSKGGIDLSYNW